MIFYFFGVYKNNGYFCKNYKPVIIIKIMCTEILNRKELVTAYESGDVMNVNGHFLTVTAMYQNGSGEWKYNVIVDDEEMTGRYLCHIRQACGLAERTTKRMSTIVPKGQRAEKTAANVDKTTTRRYSFKGLSVEDTQNLAYQRVDMLREEQRRIEREIDLLLAFTREECIEKERNILKARETAANGRKRDLKARVERLQSYIDTYAKRIGDTMLSGNYEKAQILVATQAARMARAQILIAELNK